MERKFSFTFKKALLIYAGILIVAVSVALWKVWDVLEEFEAAQSVYAAEDFVTDFTADPEAYIDEKSFEEAAGFETSSDLKAAFVDFIKSGEITCSAASGRATGSSPEYNILRGDEIIGTLKLNMVSEIFKLVVLQIPEWEIVSFTPKYDFLLKSYTLVAPKEFEVTVNGVALTEADVMYSSDNLEQYVMNGLLGEPQIEVVDKYGSAATCEIEDLYVDVSFEKYEFSLPEDFVLTDSEGVTVAGETVKDVKNYVLYSAKPFDDEFFQSNYKLSDVLGNEITYSYKDEKIFAQYAEYEITIPEGYSVSANKNILGKEYQVDSSKLEEFQYSDIDELVIYKAALADVEGLSIKDEKGREVEYVTEGRNIYIETADYTITLPENFEFTVNGREPLEAAIVSYEENPEYQYVAEYIDMPATVSYCFKGLVKAPEVKIIDNAGNVSEHVLTADGLVIDRQTGYESVPVELASEVDVLEIAKIWSRYMSDDLGGELYGYYKVLPYLIQGSYYQKVAYDWGTGGTIYYITLHTLDNPPFSDEKVENVVVYDETCFSCDISFIKHLHLTRSGMKLEDYFYNRIYFVYSDDSDDGVDNPHWAIADIKYLGKENTEE